MALALRRGTFDTIDSPSVASATRGARIPVGRSLLAIDCLFDASPIAQCLIDTAMCFAAVNRGMSAILNAPVEQLLGRSAAATVKDAEGVLARAFALAERGQTIPQKKMNWGERHYRLSFNPVRDVTGRVAGLAVAAIDMSRHRRIERRLREARRELLANSQHDHLTGLLNRRGFEAKLDRELRRARRDGAPLALLLLDIDVFKSFNDTFGHGAGDRCLKAVAAELRACLRRPGDAAARYGGEEFAVLLPNVNAQDAMAMAEICRKAVETLQVAHPASPSGTVTISIGVATASPPRNEASTAVQSSVLLDAADKALYRAKAAGRNRCEMA